MMQRSAAGLMFALLTACAGSAFAQGAKTVDGILVNASGMTLYTFDKDTANSGKSSCTGNCIALWPAFSAPDNAQANGNWTVITRDDGKKQWAYKGMPLYTWVKDTKAGDKTGDNVNKIWHVVKP